MNEAPENCHSYQDYISRIKGRLIADLAKEFPKSRIDDTQAVWDILNQIYEYEEDVHFIFVFDEWDYMFHRDFVTEDDKKAYLSFLSTLLKDQPYVELAYMTGILPIAKYSSGSELNMFNEYTMSSEQLFSSYFGFTESEVKMLYERYQKRETDYRVTLEGLKLWYDGYHTPAGDRLYNPRSVVLSLSNNNLADYWTSSGPYDEIFYYVKNNVADVRDDIALMIAGEAVSAEVREYSAVSTEIRTRDEILSAMIVYGFLTCEDGKVSIPNKELMDKFVAMVKKENLFGDIKVG